MAIRISLPNGKSKWVSMDAYLNIDWQEEWANDTGCFIDDPFYGSTLSEGSGRDDEVDSYITIDVPDVEDLDEEPDE